MSERSSHSPERVPLDGPQAQEITPSLSDAEAHRLVEKAIESVLDQVPETPDMEAGDGEAVDRSQKSQPWAETAAPPAKNKRPLEELVAEFMASVAENPDARAGK